MNLGNLALCPEPHTQKNRRERNMKNENTSKVESVGSRARHVGILAAGAAVGALLTQQAQAAITSNVLTDVEATFSEVQGMGEAASIVAATLALVSVAVSFIWRARG